MKHICLIILFILICCTINSITATEVNNTINHTIFVNDISDIINEIDYNNPIKQNGEYIQQHINYINTLNDDFKLFRSLNVKNNNSSFINPIYKGLSNTSNNNYTKNIITNNLVNKTDLKLNNNLSVVDITDKTNISLVNDSTISYNDNLDTSDNISKNIKLNNITVVNKVNNHELSKFNNTIDFNNSSVINVYPDTSNLTNNSSVKNNKSNVLFNDTLLNQNQFNKTFKGFGLDKDSSVNDNSIGLSNGSVSKELNSSEINNISNNSSKDNHIHVPEQNKDYIMLLIPIIMVLLGAIILYKKNK